MEIYLVHNLPDIGDVSDAFDDVDHDILLN